MASTVKHMTKAETRAFIGEYIKAWNDHDVDAILRHLSDDVVWMEPGLKEPVHGLAAARKDLEDMFTAFPDMHFPLEDVDVFLGEAADRAVATWTIVGTMTGKMRPGYEPTGRSMRISGTCVNRFRNGLITEHTIVFDSLDFLGQLGLMPTGEGAGFRVMLEAQNVVTRAKKALQR